MKKEMKLAELKSELEKNKREFLKCAQLKLWVKGQKHLKIYTELKAKIESL